MTPTTHQWLEAFHIFGVIVWLGSMVSLANLLLAHGRADQAARSALAGLEKKTAIFMDIGALLAIGFGVAMLANLHWTPLKAHYMHVKLTLVVLGFLGAHGFLRVQVRKFREDKVKLLPAFLPPLLQLIGLAILILVVVKPF